MDVNEFRAAGHKVVDRLAEYFESIESKAVFPKADPRMIRELFDEALPDKPFDVSSVNVTDYHEQHPGSYKL